jgi:hypothetical protein
MPMGRLDQYAKEIFAQETPAVTHGGAVFQPPTELNLSEVRLDGSLLVRRPGQLRELAAPWCLAGEEDEITLEIKMQGEHLDMRATERALLRRQARQVQRMENPRVPWDGDLPVWIAASHLPAALRRRRTVALVAPGCYRVETGAFQFLWVAANELPLLEELVPFLIARTGRSLAHFARWIFLRRSTDWLLRMVEFLPMTLAHHEQLARFILMETDDPEIKARQQSLARAYVKVTLETIPEFRNEMKDEVKAEVRNEVKAEVRNEVKAEVRNEVKAEVRNEVKAEVRNEVETEARLTEARAMLRRVLVRRGLPVNAEEEARIDACADLATLERWHDQAVLASTTADALRD